MVSVWFVRAPKRFVWHSNVEHFSNVFFYLKIWNSTLKNSSQEFALLFLNLKINARFFKRILFEVVRNSIINFFTESSIVALLKIFLFSITYSTFVSYPFKRKNAFHPNVEIIDGPSMMASLFIICFMKFIPIHPKYSLSAC